MNLRGFRVQLALVVFIIILILGLGFQYVLRQKSIINPLNQSLKNIPGVVRSEVKPSFVQRGSYTAINLTIDPEVPMIMTFDSLKETLQATSGKYDIILEDSADQFLWGVFQQLKIVAEEAVMTGEFALLEERVRNLAVEKDIDYELAVDREFVYFRLKNKDGFLQRVVDRGTGDLKVNFHTKGVGINGEVG